MANNSQRGTSERVREKMLKMSEVARAAIDNRAEGQPEETSQANKRALEERVEEAEAAVREERDRVRDAENRAELAERRYFNCPCDHNNMTLTTYMILLFLYITSWYNN